ncbi:MAG: hypothetical protein HUJ26_13295 [Planctomycetaceae bacterium]|nr:hypothetical protein [Planctomycetaceae bacterium]
MKFGLLGDHPSLHQWWPVLTSGRRHQIEWVAGVSSADRNIPTNVNVLAEPSHLLERPELDAVLVCGGREAHLQTAKRLASQNIPLIILPAANQGTAFLYELSLIRDDLRVPLSPLFPLRRHPLVNRFRELLDNQTAGEILEISIQRQHPRTGDDPRIKIIDCNQHLLLDVDLFWQLSGKYGQVTALRTGEQDAAVATQNVTLSAPHLPEAIWSIVPADEESWTLTVRGTKQTITMSGGPFSQVHKLTWGDQEEIPDLAEVEEAFLEELDAIEANARDPRLQGDWQEFVHAMELVEATQQSIRRRRTVDLYFDMTSERSQFKTQMAALGCGVLMLTLLLLIAVLMLGQMLSPAAMKWARILAFTPLFLFLAMQILIVLARPSVSESTSETA